MPVRYFDCTKEQSVADFGGNNRGSGNDLHAPVGLSAGNLFRELQRFDHDWSGVYQIEKAELILTRTGGVHVAFGGSPRIQGRRVTAEWSENGGGENSWSASASTHWGNKPSTSGSGVADLALQATGADGTSKLDVTDIMEAVAPASVLKRNGQPCGGNTNRGIELRSFDEGSSSRTTEFYTRRAAAARRPQIKLTFSDNAPPLAPTVTSPVGTTDAAVIGTASGTEDTTSFGYSDPDGDAIALVQLQYYDAFATDDESGNIIAGTLMRDTGGVTPTPLGAQSAYSRTVTSLPAKTSMRKRLRAQDARGRWGPWTRLSEGFIRTAYRPGVPSNPVMQTTPDRPHIYGTLDGPGTISGWEGEFYRDTTSGRITLWAPGMQDIGGSPTRSDVEYQGTTLNPGDVVRWKHRHRNEDGVVGDWSPEYSTTIREQIGPTITPADTGTKLLSRTAQITITFPQASDGYGYRLYRGGALVHDSGLVVIGSASSVNVNLPTVSGAPVATWCDELEIEAAARPTGSGAALGSASAPWSPRSGLRINCLPTTSLTVSA